jgi:hypothetical protein
MSNKRDLKAFVRFDGSGRIVAGSLILRKNKPKVGKWHEIQAYECCNYVPTTTTTSTTTAYPGLYYNADSGSQAACNQAGAYSLPLTFVLEDACSGGTFTLAVGTWSSYGIPTNGSSIYVNIGTGNVVQLIPTGTTASSNEGCISCA